MGRHAALSPPQRDAHGAAMMIDGATRANLELTRTLSGERRGSLLHAIDRTVSAVGSRLLAQRLAAPLTDVDAIAARLDAVEAFVTDSGLREDIRKVLRHAPDMARALARLTVGRGGPRDLAALRDGTAAADAALELLARLKTVPSELQVAADALKQPPRDLAPNFRRRWPMSRRSTRRDGGFVRVRL